MMIDAFTLASIVGASILTVFLTLLVRLIRPKVISFPWPTKGGLGDKKDVVILAGSYNPPHNGHLAMLSYLSGRYGSVIAVVGMNPDKRYDVSPQERARMIEKMVAADASIGKTKNVTVRVVTGYIWRFGKRVNARLFFRGVRTWDKDGRDEQYLHFLNTFGPIWFGPLTWPIATVYLEGDPRYNHISSTLVRDICTAAKRKNQSADLSGLVPDSIAADVADAYSS